MLTDSLAQQHPGGMADSNGLNLREATEELIRGYHEVNGPINEFNDMLSIPEFLHFIRLNRPFVIRRGCAEWPAMRWNAAVLKHKMGQRPVRIAETPHGNADSATFTKEGLRVFVTPSERSQPFSDFLTSLQAASAHDSSHQEHSVFYSQAQNDNLRSEYLPLYEDVPSSIPEMTVALGREPDAVNFWLGNNSSTTSLHRDNYENIYAQICGSKTFVLIPPTEAACVNEQFLRCATYVREGQWSIVLDEPENQVPVALWDPDRPAENATCFSSLSNPLRVRLNEGDLLYLPACWYHKVTQETSAEGFSCSVNYWYDMDFDGGFYTATTFIRHMAWMAGKEGSIGKHEDEKI